MSADSVKPDNASSGAAPAPRDTVLRREREAAALRDNLVRRKAQSRARQQADAESLDKNPSTCR